MPTPRIGLVLGGGGARGAFTAGVVHYLQAVERIRRYPVVSGTSTGALVGALACTGQFALLKKLYTTVQAGDIVNPHLGTLAGVIGPLAAGAVHLALGGRAMFHARALAELIENNVDFDLLKEASDRSLLVLNAVDLATGDVVRYDNRRHGPATLKKALLASSSEPVFMDPVQIGDRTLVDGGVRDLVPLAAAFESGVEVDAMVVIVTNPLEAERLPAPPSSGLDILGRTVEILLAETGLNDLRLAQTLNALVRVARNARDAGLDDAALFDGVDASYAEAVDDLRSVPIVPVAPRERLELDSLDFEPGAMSRLFDLGVERGREVLAPLLADWPPPIFEL